MYADVSSTCAISFGFICVLLVLDKCGLVSTDASFCWPFNFVPYTIKPGFTHYQQKYIKKQIDNFNKKTCIYWSDMDESESIKNLTNFVRFEKGIDGPCRTHIEFAFKRRPLKVTIILVDQCFVGSHVLHEILHALGFDHEHQRRDRNCYVWVSDPAKLTIDYNIGLSLPNIDKFPYDKLSVMHYRRSDDLRALSERFYQWEPMGSDDALLTDLDLWKIQYKFCGRPHYCDVHPQHCRDMEMEELKMNCSI